MYSELFIDDAAIAHRQNERQKAGVHMTVEDLVKHYIKTFRTGPKSSRTRKAYDKFQQHGDALGVDLPAKFFERLMEQQKQEPEKYRGGSEEEINRAILAQMQSYMEEVQEMEPKGFQAEPKPERKNKERGQSIEPF